MDSDYTKSELESIKKLCSKCSCGVIPEAIQERLSNVIKEVDSQ